MKYLSDLHTHSIVSGHAYTTLLENINYCVEKGLKILGTSEHAPSMPGAPHAWYFGNLKVVPRIINGITILKGCEANILDIDGNIDLPSEASRFLDYMIVSFHEPVFEPKSLEENTNALINALDKNPLIEILGHLGNPSYELNYETIVKKAKEKNIMIEINNSSISGSSRAGSSSNCKKIAELCMKYGTKIILSSDAHISFNIGNFDGSIKILESINFPEELIMNDPDKLISHIKSKGRLADL
ncbi:PHP domain-containing protein [Clostridium sp. SHJSY1]|uniref:PHP domain-containing protein n=1 Tax=Clostridium sp. SHJSY1 TaxID=2942483 RepID=UPI002876CFC4|nr:PHP domain-containing protein [Clostridium sp. SHJSY1]MDS0525374.1 PHP domain-containing protein [Clostridium sp. SHJSY1]